MSAEQLDLVEEVRAKYDELTSGQKKIAENLTNDLEFAAFATVDQFAARQGVSPSTVVRFAYRLGFEGYPELQSRVRDLMMRRLKRAGPDGGDDAEGDEADAAVWRRSVRHDIDNLRDALGTVEGPAFDEALDAIASARQIYAVGNLTSHCIAYYAAMTLNRVRGGTVLVGDHEAYAIDLADLARHDLVLAVTYPPYAKRTVELAKWARSRKATVVAITDGPLSPVAESADVLLTCRASGLAAQNSLVAPLALVNALVNALTVREPDKTLERYRAIGNLLSELGTYVLAPEDPKERSGGK